jgi:quercetin dioxygenase-like cupin family protein
MQVTKLEDARAYEAAMHVGVAGLRLQGAEATKTDAFWCGLSYYLPGGRAERSSSKVERVYIVVQGKITVVTDQGETVLGPLDSCHIAPNEIRTVENRTNEVASMLVIVPNAPVTK